MKKVKKRIYILYKYLCLYVGTLEETIELNIWSLGYVFKEKLTGLGINFPSHRTIYNTK